MHRTIDNSLTLLTGEGTVNWWSERAHSVLLFHTHQTVHGAAYKTNNTVI